MAAAQKGGVVTKPWILGEFGSNFKQSDLMRIRVAFSSKSYLLLTM
jgi:hypothetical protein